MSSFMERFGPRLVANGYPVLPIMPGTKKPGRFRGNVWSDYPDWTRHAERPTTEHELGVWSTWPDAGVGIACGPVVAVDIDITDAELALELERLARARLGDTPALRIGRAPKRLLLVDNTEGLGNGEQIEYKVNVVNDSTSLEVALCWTDFPGNPAVINQLVNNLNLTVTNGVLTYRGNVYSAGFSATGGSYDNVNVEEAVLVRFPAPGVWTVRVQGASVPAGPQPFALAITGGVGINAGMLALDVSRVEAGLLLIEVDFNSSKKALVDEQRYSPFEMGLGRLVNLDKNRFVGQAALIAEQKRGHAREIVGLEID